MPGRRVPVDVQPTAPPPRSPHASPSRGARRTNVHKANPTTSRWRAPGPGGARGRRRQGPRASEGPRLVQGPPPARDASASEGARPPARPALRARVPSVSPPPPRSSRARTGVLAPRPPPSLKPPAQAASYLRPSPPRLTAPRAVARAATAAPPASAPAASPPPSWLRSEVTSGGAGRGLRSPSPARRRGGLRRRTARRPRAPRTWTRCLPAVPDPGRAGLDHESHKPLTPRGHRGPDARRPNDSRWRGRPSQGHRGAHERRRLWKKTPRPAPAARRVQSDRTEGLGFCAIKSYYKNPQPFIKDRGEGKWVHH